jgi:hypothetical protein
MALLTQFASFYVNPFGEKFVTDATVPGANFWPSGNNYNCSNFPFKTE